jgi:AmmeMemoRadiSam system protein A
MAIPQEDRETLLALARESVAAAVGGSPPTSPPKPQGTLAQRRGCFVTLTNRGRLRGCIGTFRPTRPLGEQVVEMAAAAADDPRFLHQRITPAEVPQLTVQVSVLSELEPIDDPLQIELGRHGIYITRGLASGCFLPEVATETGWSKQEFLSHCCGGKAGLPPDAWKRPDTKVYVFTSEKFSDPPA